MNVRLIVPSLVAAIGALATALAACGDDDDAGVTPVAPGGSPTVGSSVVIPTPVVTPSTGGSADTRQPLLQGPSAKYAPSEDDLKSFYRASVPDTYAVNNEIFETIGPFETPGEARESIKQWGFAEGWVVTLEPEGLLSAVVSRGSFYPSIETFLFTTPEGAEKAYLQFEKYYKSNPATALQTAKPLANQSSSYRLQKGKVGNTQMDAVYHRFLFRRGNMVAIVQTFGGVPFMTIDAARDLAVIMDARALGERPAPLPTPPGSGLPTQTTGGRP
jgi:hypothetical protein